MWPLKTLLMVVWPLGGSRRPSLPFVLFAIKAAHTRRFFTRALKHALAAGDWPSVEACRCRLLEFDRQAAAGLALRAHVPLRPEEEHLFVRSGRSP
jgi:hypothetical protein